MSIVYQFKNTNLNKKVGKMNHIKTKEQARQYGIDFQKWASEKSLSYGEVSHFQNKLFTLAKKFHLVKEFKENGII
jgi:hypothetical protein